MQHGESQDSLAANARIAAFLSHVPKARSRALLAKGAEAEALYQKAIAHLERVSSIAHHCRRFAMARYLLFLPICRSNARC